MPKINVERAFTLRLNDGQTIEFKPGIQMVDAEIAAHWFVQAHLVGATHEPKVGSYEYALQGRAKRSEAELAAAELDAAADAEAKAEAEAKAADMIAKTQQAIAAGAQQAQDAITKDDPKPAEDATDLPKIPLASKPEGAQGGEPAGETKAE
jgi:hypothetical protein